MYQNILTFIVLMLPAASIWSQEDFYVVDHIPEIRIYFEEDNWDNLLDSLYIVGDEARLGGNVIIDGNFYPKVGVRYKGYSSYSPSRVKNPFNIDLDYTIPSQNHQGFRKIKLSNVIQDPSFVREALSYHIAGKYMPASRANFANVYVNDTLIGLYTNVEAVSSDFLEQHFGESNNTFVKCNPETVSLNGENSNLSNSPGTDVSDYYSLYDMKSDGDADWNNFYELIDVLNTDPANVDEVLNVDRALWMHAVNYTLINFDSYVGYAQNYYLYQTSDGRFQPILWDLNMSFASYRLTDASDNWDGFTVNEAKTIDPLQHWNSFSVQPRPLIRNLLDNDTYRRMYLAHIRTIVTENFSNMDFYDVAENLQTIIDADVQADPNKFYSYDMFQDNLDSTVTDLVAYPGIKDLMVARATYLLNYPGMNAAPFVDNVVEVSPTGLTHNDFWVTAAVQSSYSSEVYLAYRYSPADPFQFVAMTDDGASGDGAAGDGVYGAYFQDPGYGMQYYIYAENDSAGTFSPARAAYEFYRADLQMTAADIVLNEKMGSNEVVTDNAGEFAAWIELYVPGTSEISLDSIQLANTSGDVWNLPARRIPGGSYMLVWLDGDTIQGSNHCSFSSDSGDTIYLRNNDGTLIHEILLVGYDGETSSGRWPDIEGTFTEMIPTPGEANQLSEVPILDELMFVYPNPASTRLDIRLNYGAASIDLISMDGKSVKSFEMAQGTTSMLLTEFASGVYILQASGENFTVSKRIIIEK